MLAGLIFATDDASDRPDQLTATLPFGGRTLIEFQARLLIAAGAAHILVAVERLTPELLGAINRLTRLGTPVDAVRSAAEAVAKVHPLARIVMVADGLVTTDDVVALVSGEGEDTLLITDDAGALPGLERVGVNAVWAGLARFSAARLAEVAELPKDYDFGSTVLRVLAQGGAAHLPLPPGQGRGAHGVEHDSRKLADRNDLLVAAHVSGHAAWIDRYLHAPLARRLLPLLTRQGIGAVTIAASAGVLAALGLLLVAWRFTGLGLPLVIIANAAFMVGAVLAWMRDEQDLARIQQLVGQFGSGIALLLLGRGLSVGVGGLTPLVLAIAAASAMLLGERACAGPRRRSWWASPAAYPLILLPFALAGQGIVGLGVVAIYGAISLGAAIEALRRQA